MAKVFVSYSRKDIEFTKRLTEELRKNKLEFWVDWEGIPPTVDFMKQIETGIEESDVFLFLLSPDSAKSKVCGEEVAHAIKHSKRLIPLVVRDVNSEDVPPALSHLNWIFFREQDDFDVSFKKLLLGINTDFDWVETHRRLLVRALEWQSKNKDKSFLLRGQDLHDAEAQLALNTSKDPHPTDLHREYILKSRQAADQQRRLTTIIAAVAAVIMFALAVYGLDAARRATAAAEQAQAEANRANESEKREATAKKLAQIKETEANINQLASLAISKIDQSFNEALLLSVEAYLHAKDNKINDLNTQSAISKVLQSNPGLIQILVAHTDWVNTMAFDPNRNILISGSWDKTAVIWDISTPNFPVKLKTLTDFTAPIESASFSSDGKILATSSDKELILWDAPDPASPKLISKTDGYYTDLGFSQNSKFLSTLKIYEDVNNVVTIIDVSNLASPIESKFFESNDENVDIKKSLFDPNKNLLFYALENGDILTWNITDPNTPVLLSTIKGDGSQVYSMVISPDGNTLAVGDAGKIISLWDISDLGAPFKISSWGGHSFAVNSLAFSLDGKELASSSNDQNAQVIVWDISDEYTPIKINTINGHSLGVNSLLFDRQNDFLLSGSRDGTIMIWNFSNKKTELEVGSIPAPGPDLTNDGFVFKPNDNILISLDSDKKFSAWDVSDPAEPKKTKNNKGPADFVAFSNDGTLMASTDHSDKAILWNASDFSELGTVTLAGETINTAKFSPDGKILAVNGEKIALWDISNPKKPASLVVFPQDKNEMSNMVFSPDGKLLASVSQKNVVLWDISDLKKPTRISTLEGHTARVFSIAFSPTNPALFASAGEDKTIVLWDITDPKQPQKINTLGNHSDWISSLAFSPDGSMLASGSYDKQVNLWNVANPASPILVSKMIGHENSVRTVTFDSFGKLLASLDYYGVIVFWDINPESWAQKACTITGGDLTDIQWNQYFPTEKYNKTCKAFNTSEAAIVPAPIEGQNTLLPACTASQTPSCTEPEYDTTDMFCVDNNAYGLYTLSPDTTFDVLTPGFTCISEDTNSRGEPRISCTGPADKEFQVSFCNSTCTNSLETSNQCQAGFGLNAAGGCCAPLSATNNGCVTSTFILASCGE